MARLPLVRASGAARESRRVRRQAQHAVVRYFRGNLQSNPRVHATVCGIPPAACHRIGLTYFAILRLAPASYLLSLTPRFTGVASAQPSLRIVSAVCHGIKTAEAVRAFVTSRCTRLKPGVNGRTSASKRKTETEVKRPEIFELVRVRIHTVVETNWAHRQLVTQTPTNRVAHVAQPNVLGSWQ